MCEIDMCDTTHMTRGRVQHDSLMCVKAAQGTAAVYLV